MMQMQRDNNVIEEPEQIKGSLDLSHADCDNAEEAIGSLFCGHISFDEYAISVGDDVVTCIVRKDGDAVDGRRRRRSQPGKDRGWPHRAHGGCRHET